MARFSLPLLSLLLMTQPFLPLAQNPPLPFVPDFSSSTTCPPNSQCRNLTLAGFAFESSQHAAAIAASPFYVVPSNFSRQLEPGSLLSVERVTSPANYAVPSGLTLSRIMYTTADFNGTVQPATAYIL